MSKEAFSETASYDAMIYNYFNSLNKNINDAPKKLILNANLVQKLRYGGEPTSVWSYIQTMKILNLKNYKERFKL